MRRAREIVVLGLVVYCACLPASAQASPSVRLTATLTPERLGHTTTVGFGFDIRGPAGQVPPPLTGLDVRYPRGLGPAASGLGVATCSEAKLEVMGPAGCPPNSRMGYGSALTEIQIGPEVVVETADIAVVRAPSKARHFVLLFYANGRTPVDAQIVFQGIVGPAPSPFGGSLHIEVPLVPSLPEAPDVSVVRVRSTIGPRHLTYFEEVNGRRVAYVPNGIPLPDRCPRGGFRFAAQFAFQGGSRASAQTAVPCPRSGSRVHRSRRA